MAMTRDQCRAARALLDWTQDHLASLAAVPATAVAAYESGKGVADAGVVASIRHALEGGGIEFIAESGSRGVGVRLRKRRGPADEGLHPSQLTSENTD